MIAASPNFHSKRIARYSTIPIHTTRSASAPFSASSLPTWGPTNSTRRNSTSLLSACKVAITFCERSVLDCPWTSGILIRTSRDEPKFCTAVSL